MDPTKREQLLIPGEYSCIPNSILRSTELTPSDRIVYISLLSHLGKNDSAWPSFQQMCDETGLPYRTMKRCMHRLQEASLIYHNGWVGQIKKWSFGPLPVVALPLEDRGHGGPEPWATVAPDMGHGGPEPLFSVAPNHCSPWPTEPKKEPRQEPTHLTTEEELTHLETEMDTQTKQQMKSLLQCWKQNELPLPALPTEVKLLSLLLEAQQKKVKCLLKPALVLLGLKLSGKKIQLSQLFRKEKKSFLWLCLQDSAQTAQTAEGWQEPFFDTDIVLRIYRAYPRHIGKAAAMEQIQAALLRLKSKKDPEGYLLERVELFAASAAGNAGKFTPHPATWFKHERYEDDQEEWDAGGENRSGSIKRVEVETDDEPGDDGSEFLNRFNR